MSSRHPIAIFVLLLGLPACQPEPPLMTDQQADSAVRRFLAVEDSVTSAEDLEGFLGLVADDAVFLPPGESGLEGKEAIRASYANAFRAFDVQLQHLPGPVESRGNVIIHRGNARGVLRPRAGGDSVLLDNKYLFVLRVADDRSLLHWRAMFNANPVAAIR